MGNSLNKRPESRYFAELDKHPYFVEERSHDHTKSRSAVYKYGK